MMKGRTCPKTIKFDDLHDVIAASYSNGIRVKDLCVRYNRSKTWIYHVVYCYGLAKRAPLTVERDPLNYHRLQRYLKRTQVDKSESNRSVPGAQASQL